MRNISSYRGGGERDAFSILEVMIALAIFFMCVFAILGLVARSLAQARNLKPIEVDAISAFAELSLTNRLEEGPLPPEIIQDFEAMYPGYTVGGDITEIATNGLYQIDFYVGGLTSTKAGAATTSSVLLFRPAGVRGGRPALNR
jgi:Tfp pilus assembly protein PilV